MKKEPQATVTIRMPRSEHAAIWREAHANRISMNTLCRIKLREPVDPDKVPHPDWAACMAALSPGQQPPEE